MLKFENLLNFDVTENVSYFRTIQPNLTKKYTAKSGYRTAHLANIKLIS